MWLEASHRLIYPRTTLALAMCLTLLVRMRRMIFTPTHRSPG